MTFHPALEAVVPAWLPARYIPELLCGRAMPLTGVRQPMLSEELGLAFGKPPDHCEDSPGLEQGSQTTGPAAVGFVPKPDPLMVIAVPYVAEPDTPLTCGAATASCVTMPHANK